MTTKRRSTARSKSAPQKRHEGKQPEQQPKDAGVLARHGCDWLQYEFLFPRSVVRWKSLPGSGAFAAGDRWQALTLGSDPSSGYHVHFDGFIYQKEARIRVAYCTNAKTQDHLLKAGTHRDKRGPYAEEFMQWFGTVLKESTARARVQADFSKDVKTWKSRFNLPFRVTMAGKEVVIHGVALDLPPNPQRMQFGFISTHGDNLDVVLNGIRPVVFESFSLSAELESISEVLQTITERQ